MDVDRLFIQFRPFCLQSRNFKAKRLMHDKDCKKVRKNERRHYQKNEFKCVCVSLCECVCVYVCCRLAKFYSLFHSVTLSLTLSRTHTHTFKHTFKHTHIHFFEPRFFLPFQQKNVIRNSFCSLFQFIQIFLAKKVRFLSQLNRFQIVRNTFT